MASLAIIRGWWRNTKDLPFPLDMLCQGAMVVAPILFVFVALPIVDWTINGRQMSYAELWKSGAGLAFGLFLFLVMMGSWGLAARNPRSRWALVAAPSAPYVASIPFLNSGLLSTEDVLFGILGGLAMAAIAYACLFRLPAVRRYFAGGRDARGRQSAEP
jgi:hypothetical protein